jgi:DNA gyrase/topoisomerase IV subunit A
MIHPDDVAAWIAQVRQQPEAAPGIIEALAARLMELDQQNEALRDELLRLRRNREITPDEGQVAVLSRRVQVLERQLERGVQAGPGEVARSLLVFTLDGRAARLSLPGAAAWRERDNLEAVASHLRPHHLLVAADEDKLLLFSDKGRATRVNVADVDLSDVPVNYLSLLPGLMLDLDESVSAALPLAPIFDRLTLVTRKGYVRSLRRAEVDSLLERNLPLHSSPVQGDYPAFVLLSDGQSELLVVTRRGKGVRFSERMVGVQSSPAIKLERGDVVAGAAVVGDETTVVLIGAEGVAARREMAGFAAHPTAGNRGKIVTRIGDLIAAAAVEEDDVLWLLATTGQLLVVPAATIPSGPGASRGKRVVRLGEDRLVALAVSKGA